MHLGWICTLIEFLPGSDVALDMRKGVFKGMGYMIHVHYIYMAYIWREWDPFGPLILRVGGPGGPFLMLFLGTRGKDCLIIA